jgi:glycosyltransferase involved in cell wall biosynthesis
MTRKRIRDVSTYEGPLNIAVSVVIPSIGRDCLQDAIDSVLKQNLTQKLELIVVFDLAKDGVPAAAAKAATMADKVLYTGGGKRACHARNLGVSAAGGKWVAFLDDDDAWHETKLGRQLEAAIGLKAQGRRAVVGSRATLLIGTVNPTRVTGVPVKLITPSDSVEDYLFSHRRPGSRRASFFTSSILADRQLCVDVPWDESLERHQDWDWLVRVGRMDAVTFIQDEADLITYNVGTEGSISAKADWAPSLSWAESTLRRSSARARADFLAAQTLRYALQMRTIEGVVKTAGSIMRTRRFPSPGALIIGLAGVIPRKQIQRLMTVLK